MEQTPSTIHGLADALGDVRAEIRVLKAREAHLRAALLDARPNGPVAGRHYEVHIRETERKVFDRDALPKAILGDHRFWMIRRSQTVVTRARETSAPPSPAKEARRPGRDLWGEQTERVLFENP